MKCNDILPGTQNNNVQLYVSTYDQSRLLTPTVSILSFSPKEYRNISLTC
jgi:hypothetical protein